MSFRCHLLSIITVQDPPPPAKGLDGNGTNRVSVCRGGPAQLVSRWGGYFTAVHDRGVRFIDRFCKGAPYEAGIENQAFWPG